MLVLALRHAASVLLRLDKLCWILTIPLIHMISGTSLLQNRPDNRHTPDWWGVAGIKAEVDTQKRSGNTR